MGDEIPVRRATQPSAEPRSAPPVPRRMMSEFRASSTPKPEPNLPPRPVMAQPATVSQQAPPMPATDQPESPALLAAPQSPVVSSGKRNIFRRYWRHKLWTIPLTLLVIIGGFAAVPTTRYMALAYFVSRPFTVTVTDSSTNTPISGASVKLDGHSALTGSDGKAIVTVPVGSRMLSISKTYYKSSSQTVFVDLSAAANSLTLHLVATGRQVPLKVINKITGKPIPEAQLTIGATTAQTDLSGQATVVLPADSPSVSATIKADGYTDLTATVQVAANAGAANTFAMVPNGRVYFLSNASGTLDVVSTNLDGSGRKTVVAGTGQELSNTQLLASRDWKYLVLLSRRGGGGWDGLYLIDTTTGHLTEFDGDSSVFTLIGWVEHTFVYQISRDEVTTVQAGKFQLRSYNADTGKRTIIASNKATGTDQNNVQYQSFDQTVIIGSKVVYAANWYHGAGLAGSAGQQSMLVSMKSDGTSSKTLQSVDAEQYTIANLNLASPNQLYFATTPIGSASANYYRLDSNGNSTQSSTITAATVGQAYPVYWLSPSGTQTFWTTISSSANNLHTGDANGANGTLIATASDYAPYGWFTDNYLLARKDNTLYIMPVAGGTPLKISDFVTHSEPIMTFGTAYGGQ